MVDSFNRHDQGDGMYLFQNSVEGYPQFQYQMYYDLMPSEQVFNIYLLYYECCRTHG